MAVCRPTGQEAQTAAGVRGSRFLPKTARRAPQALEAGAFWDHRPKSLPVRSLAVLLRTVSPVFVWVWVWWPFLGWCVTEDVYSLTAYPAGGHFLVRQKVTKERPGLRPGPDGQRRQSLGERSPNAAWTAWARFFCMGDSLNLIVWLLNAWLGGWPCWGTGSSGLAGGALWLAPSFRLA